MVALDGEYVWPLNVGSFEGTALGDSVEGAKLGPLLGEVEGCEVEGLRLGLGVSPNLVGDSVGRVVGLRDGRLDVGLLLGLSVGLRLGTCVAHVAFCDAVSIACTVKLDTMAEDTYTGLFTVVHLHCRKGSSLPEIQYWSHQLQRPTQLLSTLAAVHAGCLYGVCV